MEKFGCHVPLKFEEEVFRTSGGLLLAISSSNQDKFACPLTSIHLPPSVSAISPARPDYVEKISGLGRSRTSCMNESIGTHYK